MSENFLKILNLFLIILIIYLGFSIYKEKKSNEPYKKSLREYVNYVQRLEKENKELKERLEYLSNFENLKKELKEKFNLVEPGEKVIILPQNF